jgi:hypothetical protein
MFNGRIIRAAAILATLLAFPYASLYAQVQLKQETIKGFDNYIRFRESQMNHDWADQQSYNKSKHVLNFLSIDALPDTIRDKSYAELNQGRILIQNAAGADAAAAVSVPGGLIHDWTATIFVPDVSLVQVLSLLQDYDHDGDFYGPQVVKSQLLQHSNNNFRVFLRLRQANIVTVVFDTEYEVQYFSWDLTHAYSRSYSTRIQQVDNPGQPDEHKRPEGSDDGYLWRLYSYWRFYEADGGVYIQCEAISLTRDIPAGLGWIVKPFIENIPVDSLQSTMGETRAALLKKFASSIKQPKTAGPAVSIVRVTPEVITPIKNHSRRERCPLESCPWS